MRSTSWRRKVEVMYLISATYGTMIAKRPESKIRRGHAVTSSSWTRRGWERHVGRTHSFLIGWTTLPCMLDSAIWGISGLQLFLRRGYPPGRAFFWPVRGRDASLHDFDRVGGPRTAFLAANSPI
jgi:hypothetical protein